MFFPHTFFHNYYYAIHPESAQISRSRLRAQKPLLLNDIKLPCKKKKPRKPRHSCYIRRTQSWCLYDQHLSHLTVGVLNYNVRAKLQQRGPSDLRGPKPFFTKPSPLRWCFLLQPRTRPVLRDCTRDTHPDWADGRPTARWTRQRPRVVGGGGRTIRSRARQRGRCRCVTARAGRGLGPG